MFSINKIKKFYTSKMSARLGVGYEENNSPAMKAIKNFNRTQKGMNKMEQTKTYREKYGPHPPRGANFKDSIEIPPVSYEGFRYKPTTLGGYVFVVIIIVVSVMFLMYILKPFFKGLDSTMKLRFGKVKTEGGECCNVCGSYPCVCVKESTGTATENQVLLGGGGDVMRTSYNFTDFTDTNTYAKKHNFII